MQDHLAEWLSNEPKYIKQIKNNPHLEWALRHLPYQPKKREVTDQQWNQITTSLTQ